MSDLAVVPKDAATTECAPLEQLMRKLRELVFDGLRHGFFDVSISGEIGPQGKRHVLLKSGRSHKFTLREDELPR